MKKKYLFNYSLGLVTAAYILAVTSCSSIKNVKYFANLPDSGKNEQFKAVQFVEPVIQPDDILAIDIRVVDPEATKVLALGNLQSSAVGNSSTGSTGGQTVSGILVDRNGNVDMPVLGVMHFAGLTTNKVRELVRERAASAGYKDPSVNVRFANFKITILGEVTKPGTYVVSNEKITLLDALGLAGDLTIYGKRDNVLLIRQYEDGSKESTRINLTDSKILTSKYYYLRQNDYIYVEPVKTKVVASDAIQNRNINILTAITASLISLIAIVISTRR